MQHARQRRERRARIGDGAEGRVTRRQQESEKIKDVDAPTSAAAITDTRRAKRQALWPAQSVTEIDEPHPKIDMATHGDNLGGERRRSKPHQASVPPAAGRSRGIGRVLAASAGECLDIGPSVEEFTKRPGSGAAEN